MPRHPRRDRSRCNARDDAARAAPRIGRHCQNGPRARPAPSRAAPRERDTRFRARCPEAACGRLRRPLPVSGDPIARRASRAPRDAAGSAECRARCRRRADPRATARTAAPRPSVSVVAPRRSRLLSGDPPLWLRPPLDGSSVAGPLVSACSQLRQFLNHENLSIRVGARWLWPCETHRISGRKRSVAPRERAGVRRPLAGIRTGGPFASLPRGGGRHRAAVSDEARDRATR